MCFVSRLSSEGLHLPLKLNIFSLLISGPRTPDGNLDVFSSLLWVSLTLLITDRNLTHRTADRKQKQIQAQDSWLPVQGTIHPASPMS